jgi:tRNA G18 (ribose-2'-O)-methylase SpoU
MNLINIEDIDSNELQIYKTLRDKQISSDNSFVADSPKVVNILLQTDIKIRSILATQEYYDEYKELIEKKEIDKLYLASKEMMQNIVGHNIHHNVMAHGTRADEHRVYELDDQIIMLDNITSTENIGSIARSAAGIGIYSYLLSNQSPHPYTRRALRVSMGHISKLKYSIYDDILSTIAKLKELGYRVYGAEITPTSIPLSKVQVANQWVIIMGHEGNGLSQEVIDACDEIVTIEMADDVKSFNVAVASSIIMYTFKNS